MEKQKVLIPVDVEKEMPEVGEKVSVSFSGGKDFNNLAVGKKGWTANDVGYSHWLKEQEGYFFTPEEMEQFAIQCRSKVLNTVIEYIQSLNIK
jgi:hypothetical protein